MRKYIRSALRAEAKRRKQKPSKWVAAAWDYYQTKRFGAENRKICQAVGTHKKSLWASRVAIFASK